MSARVSPPGSQLIPGDADTDRKVVPHFLADGFNHLQGKADTIFFGTPVFIGSNILKRRHELEGQITMGAVDLNPVEAGLPHPGGAFGIAANQFADFFDRQGPGLPP